MGRGRTLTRAGLTFTAVAFGAAAAFAQTAEAPYSGVLSFTTGIDVDTNRYLDFVSPGTSFRAYERLEYSMRAETETQVFEFLAGTQLEFNSISGGGSETRLNDTNIRFLYSRDTGNSFISLDGDYWSGDAVDAFDTDPSDPSFIRADDGRLLRTNTNFFFRTGINDPIGFWVDAGYETDGYTDTSDPGLVDSTTADLELGASFRFSKATEGTLSVGREDFSEDTTLSRNVLTSDVTLGITHELRSALTLNGELSYEERETSNILGSVLESGYIVGVDFVQERSNGTLFGGIEYDGSRFRDETSISIGRTLDLPDGSLLASLTLSNIESSGLTVLGEIEYVRRTASGQISVDISREETVDDRFRDIIFSRVGLGYERQITDASDVDVSLDFSRTEGKFFAIIPVEDRATFTASYSRAVTPEWDLNVGYRHRYYSSSRASEARSDMVFLTMTRDIEFGF